MNSEQKENLAAMLFQAMQKGGPKGEWLKVDSTQFKAKKGETPFDTLIRAVREMQKSPAKDPAHDQAAAFTARVEELVPKVSENLTKVVSSEYGADYDAKKDVIELPELGDYEDVMEYAHDLFMASSLATGSPDRFDRPGVVLDASVEQSFDVALREQLIGELVAASSFLDYGMPTRLAPDSIESLPAFEKMAVHDPKQFQAIVEDFNNAVVALREVREGQKPDFKMIAENARKKSEELQTAQKAMQEKKAKEEEKAKAEKEKKAVEMRLKSQAEQKAAERQVAFLTTALLLSKDRGRVWMNPTGKLYPGFYPKGPAISPFNAISLALHSDANGYRTNLYTTFQEARVRKEGVKAEEKGVPFNWYNWNQYVNRNNPEEKITRKQYLALSQEEKTQYKGIQNREIRTLFNIDQTMTPVIDPEGYGKAAGWNGGYQERNPSPVEEKILRNVMDEFVDSISTNLVSVERNAPLPVASYDIREDVIRVPNAGSYAHYHDYVHDTVSEIVRATGHAERLAREGAVNRTGQDALVREELIVELATGVKMLEMGMPARLSNDSLRLVVDWNKQLHDDPKMIDVVETEVNNALEVMRKAERGEKVVYSSFVNQQKVQLLQEKQKPQVSTAEGLVLADIIAHHGMEVRENNFKDKGEKEAFLEKFGMTYYLDKIEYARKMAQSDDPEVSEAAYSEVYNYAAILDQLAREYRPAEWSLKGRRNVEELIHDVMDENSKDMVIVYDEVQKKADIILPQGSFTGGKAIMPNGQERSFYLTPSEVLCQEERKDAKIQFSDAPGFSKTRIDHALTNDPKFNAVETRYFNRDGVAGFHADDRYFEGKQVFAARLNSWKLDDLRSFDIRLFVEQSRHPQFDKVLMVKDDDNRWLLYMQPQGEKPFGVYPDKADVNKFFTASHQGSPAITAAVRDELASKYYELAKVKPSLQVNLLGEKASEEDAARLQRVNIFKNKLGQFMIVAKVTDTPKEMPPREISAAQWQRLWLSPDHNEYKKDLAAKIFADLLHPERQQKEEAQQAEVHKPEPENEQKVVTKEPLSPLVKQYLDTKAKHPDALLLFRTGDFYETFKEDAVKASNILGITLTRSSKTRDEEGKPLAMAGFPYHALDSYLPRLIRAGQRVAICDQIEAPRQQVDQNPKEEETRSSHFHR